MKKSELKALIREVLQENHYAMQHPEEFDSGVAPYSQCGVRDGSNARSKPVGYKGPQEKLSLADGSDLLIAALEEIARYDKDSKFGGGICPYGCDSPHIARTALDKYYKKVK